MPYIKELDFARQDVPLESIFEKRVHSGAYSRHLWASPFLFVQINELDAALWFGSILTPVHELIVFPTSPISDFLFHNAKNALNAAFSNRSSPVNLLNVPNSRINEPAPAVPYQAICTLEFIEKNQQRDSLTCFRCFSQNHTVSQI